MTTFSFILDSPASEPPLTLAEETDLTSRALFYELWQYKDQPIFESLLAAFIDACQPLESVTWDVREGMWLDNAVGAQLNILGKYVGIERGTKTDDEYRDFIRGKILVNRSNGKLPELYEILALFTTEAEIYQFFPAALYMEVTNLEHPQEIFQLIDQARGGGIALDFVYSELYDAITFQFSSQYTAYEDSTAKGLGGAPYSPNTGGQLTGVF